MQKEEALKENKERLAEIGDLKAKIEDLEAKLQNGISKHNPEGSEKSDENV